MASETGGGGESGANRGEEGDGEKGGCEESRTGEGGEGTRTRSCESPGEEGSRESGEAPRSKCGDSTCEKSGGEGPGQESCDGSSVSEHASPSDDRGQHGYDARTDRAGSPRSIASVFAHAVGRESVTTQ